MVSKKRAVLKRVRAGLQKQTAKLSPADADAMYIKVRRRMAVTRTLDKLGIVEPKKRKRIQKIMGQIDNRVRMLVQTKTIKSIKDAAARGLGDLYIEQCRAAIRKELGGHIAFKFHYNFLGSNLYLGFKLRPKKKKLK